MAAYDDSYEIADLVKAHPGATYTEIMNLHAENRRRQSEEISRKLKEEEKERETPLEWCPTTGRTMEEEYERWKETSQAPSPIPSQDEIPSPTDLSQICKLAGTRERSSTAES